MHEDEVPGQEHADARALGIRGGTARDTLRGVVKRNAIEPREHGAVQKLWRALSYNLRTYVAKRKEITAELPWLGVSLRTGSEDMLGRRLFKTGLYEPGVTDFLPALPQRGAAGRRLRRRRERRLLQFARVSRLRRRRAGCTRFEAEPENFRQLQHNLQQAGARSVKPHNCAASDGPGTLQLYLWKSSNRGKHSLVPFAGADTVDVEAKTLDSVYRDAGLEGRTVSLLKIDIEGAEHQAFVGAADLLPRCAVIASEVSPKFLKRAGIDLDEHLALVCGRGFRMFEVHDDARVTPCTADDLRDSPKSRNVAYLREDMSDEPWVARVFRRA